MCQGRGHMKKLLLGLCLVVFISSPAFALNFTHSQPRSPAPRHYARASSVSARTMLARITVYWARGRGSDRDTRRHHSATGRRLRSGHCAVDPRRIPYGSKIQLPDGVIVAVDTGSAVVSRKAARRAGTTLEERAAIVIDRFFETRREALAWAAHHSLFCQISVTVPHWAQ